MSARQCSSYRDSLYIAISRHYPVVLDERHNVAADESSDNHSLIPERCLNRQVAQTKNGIRDVVSEGEERRREEMRMNPLERRGPFLAKAHV